MPKNFIADESGFSLPIVVTLSAVVTIGMLLILQMTLNVTRAAEGAIAQSQVQLLVSQLASILQDEQSCRITTGGAADYDDDILAEPNKQMFNTGNGAITPIKLYNPDRSLFLDPTSNTANKFGKLTVTDLSLETIAPVPTAADTYRARLRVTVTKPDGVYGGRTTTDQSIWLSVMVDDSTANTYLASCSAVTFRTTAMAVSDPPLHLPDCLSETFLYSDSNGIRCVRLYCSNGLRFRRWQADGNAVCQ